MSSGGGSGGSSTTTQELPSWAQPYAQQLLSQGASLSAQGVPQYTGQTVAALNGNQTGAISNASSASNNQSANAANATNWASGVTNGSGPSISNPYTGNVTASTAANAYADPSNNPYLASSIAAGNQAITQAYNSTTAPQTLAQFRSSGAFGGSAQQQATSNNEYQLGNALANNTANMENSAYNTAAGVAAQNAAQQNTVNLSNQAIGTNANNAYNQNLSSNYFNNIYGGASALNAATQANGGAASTAGTALTAGTAGQQNSQDQLNAAYQQWYNSVNAPYQSLSTLSSALSGALGSGAGTSLSSYSPGSGSTLASLLGLGTAGAGLYSSLSQ
jgi:hypothetical protein